MKRNRFFTAMAGAALAFGMLLGACKMDAGSDPVAVADDPAKGVMNEATAQKVFVYSPVEGGVRIDRFKDAAALRDYLSGKARALADNGVFNISIIGSLAVVQIGSGAFSPAQGAASLAVAGVITISLPVTITVIAADAFSGAEAVGGGKIKLEIPPSVMEKLPEEVKAELEKATAGGEEEEEEEESGEDPYAEIAVPASEDTLAKALAWIGSNAVDWGAYTLMVKADETIPAQSLSYEGKRVRVSLKGDAAGWEVVLNGQGSLFEVESGVTLHVENLTLKGRGNSASTANDSALVRVNSGGALRLKAGALITGNYTTINQGSGVRVYENASFTMEGGAIRGNTSGIGGGVGIDKGTFTMKGGEISGNTANDNGGGVFVWQGSFTMEGGTINGNNAEFGGGVEVNGNSTFTMKGGLIDNNTAHTLNDGDGGGVEVNGNSTFTMEGGTISGNTANEDGGGVMVAHNSTFTMKGGEIKNNNAQGGGGVAVHDNSTLTTEGGEINNNTASNGGGGVFVIDNYSTFTMEGGEMSGNTASNGGGVCVATNTVFFTKKGGTIYGDIDTTHTPGSTENTATSGTGHAVQAGSKKRNATAGPEVKLYAKYEGDVWTYNDIGGVGDTSGNWE
jgi:hypothetical protein